MMEKAQEILFHLAELYEENPSEEKIIRLCEANPVRYQAWVDAFKDYDLSDVLLAIDNFWEFKNSKTKPNVAQIKATLEQHKVAKSVQVDNSTAAKAAKGDFAWVRMNADIDAGNCRNNLYVYRDAENIIIGEWLQETLPASEYARISRNRNKRIIAAFANDLYNRFDDALVVAARRRFNRDYEYQSANDLAAEKQRVSGKNHPVIISQDRGGGFKPLAASYRS